MELKADLSKEYGIVLEGGGAKGAYQIGVWKALKEAGLRIKGVAGVSVGALNGAFICMDDLEKAEEIWSNIEYSQVMNVSDDTIRALKDKDFKSLNFQDLLSGGLKLIKDGGFDITPLKKLIADNVDEERLNHSDRELFVTTYSVSDHKELTVDIKSGDHGEAKDMLLASAYFLAFKNEKLNGKKYVDGGGVNNVPVNVLLEKGYKDIIVIRIYGLGHDSEKNVKVPEDATIYHIAPRQGLGGILEFEKKQARKNMTLGYYDAKRFLYGLCGKVYYIDAPQSEAYYFNKMISELDLIRTCIDHYMDFMGQPALEGYRGFTEDLFPKLAKKLNLKDGWDYKDLYLAIMEDLARRFKISRFKIYTTEELVSGVISKISSLDSRMRL